MLRGIDFGPSLDAAACIFHSTGEALTRTTHSFRVGAVGLAIASLAAIGACSDTGSATGSGTGAMRVQLTDAPFSSDSVSRVDPSQSSVTLKNGAVLTATSSPSVTFPSASRSGLKVNLTTPITVKTGDTVTTLVDFDVNGSFVQRGNTIAQNGLLFKPVITATVK